MLHIHQVEKSYGKKRVLKGASFSVANGQAAGIVGSNGSGKSTLLSILAGILKPDQGQFLIETGEGTQDLLTNMPLRRNLIGYVPQGTPLVEEVTALDNLRLWYQKDALDFSLRQGPLSFLGVEEFLKIPVKRLSGGMKKRLSIGCAVANDPQILLLDEACSALDLPCKEQILAFLSMHLKRGGIVIMSTHDLQEISLCSVHFLLKDGILQRYRYDGNPQKLIEAIR